MHLDTKILLIRTIDILNCFNPVMPTLKVDFTNPELSSSSSCRSLTFPVVFSRAKASHVDISNYQGRKGK